MEFLLLIKTKMLTNSVSCGTSPIQIHYFDYLKRFIKSLRLNEGYAFSIKYRYKHKSTLVIWLAWLLRRQRHVM